MPRKFLAILVSILACSWSLSAQVPEVLYLKMNTTGGATTSDKAVPGLLGVTPTLQGAGTWNTSSPKLGAAAYRSSLTPASSGVDGLATVGAITVSGDWTIEFWVRRDNFSGYLQSLFSIDSAGLRVSYDHNAPYKSVIRCVGPAWAFDFKGELDLGVWHHVALVHDAQTSTISPYFDGNPRGQFFISTPFAIAGTAGPGLLIGNASFGGPLNGSIDEFRIWGRARTEAEILATMNTQLFSTIATDVAVSDVTSPVYVPRSYVLATASEVVTAEIENIGSATLAAGTVLAISYSLNGATPVSESLTLPLPLSTGGRYLHSFATPADLSSPGHHELVVTVNLAGDQDPSNDSRTHAYGGRDHAHFIDTFPWLEDFETCGYHGSQAVPPSWIQEDEGGVTSDVYFNNTLASQIGPSSDHTTGVTGEGFWATARAHGQLTSTGCQLTSPLLDLRGLTNPRLRFWAWINAQEAPMSPGSLSIDVVQHPGATVVQDVWGPVSNLGLGWSEVQVDLSAFAGQAIQIRFRSSTTFSVGSQDMNLDDVLVYEHQVGIGQAPRPGVAEFRLNGAVNIGFNPVTSLENGPYFSAASPGDNLNFEFAGFADVPIILCYGPLNPQAATYPSPIGQLDIGGPPDPITGIPIGTAVLFSGYDGSGLGYFFWTTPAGATSVQLPLPSFPPGILTTFQGVLFDPNAGALVCSNAIQLTVN